MNIIENKNKLVIQLQNSDKLYIQYSKNRNILLINIEDEKIVISELDEKFEKKIDQEILKIESIAKK